MHSHPEEVSNAVFSLFPSSPSSFIPTN
jgi:hypothetical protein